VKILVAEDTLLYRNALESSLEQWGYDVIVTKDGNEAWTVFLQRTSEVRLALIDWMMPGMEGLELCRRIRQTELPHYVYLILVTSRREKADVVAGLDAGADDYVMKPFEPAELRSRVAVGIRMLEYETTLAEKNKALERFGSKMETLARERSEQLIHADRMATLGLMSARIAHEISNPTSFIAGNQQILSQFWGEVEPIVRQQAERDPPNRRKLKMILDETPKAVGGIANGVARISAILSGLKTFCRRDSSTRQPCNVNACVANALTLCNGALKHCAEVKQELCENLPAVPADQRQIEQVLVNLFTNAADAMGEAGGHGLLTVTTREQDGGVAVIVEDTGPGIAAKNPDDIWQPFFTSKPPGKGTGLGLSISRNIIEQHQGTIHAQNASGGGARFIITLSPAGQGEQ